MSRNNCANGLLKVFATASFLWFVVWVTNGGSTFGYNWYLKLASKLFVDAKGGVPMLTIAAPVLLTGLAIHVFALRPPEVQQPKRQQLRGLWQQHRRILPYQRLFGFKRLVENILSRFFLNSYGDRDFYRDGIIWLVLPCISYVVSVIARKVFNGQQQHLSTSDIVKEFGNALGMSAVIAMSVLLIPVARYSAIVQLFGWSPANVVQLHIWTGRIVVLGGLAHGSLHLWRWKLDDENWTTLLLPPLQCWTGTTNFLPTCHHSATDCTCYHLFRNMTGFCAGLGLILIGISSMEFVRRGSYQLFYNIHIIAGPMLLLFTLLHYNRSVLYLAGGLLYFVASSFPVLLEAYSTRKRIMIISAERIPSEASGSLARPCVSLTFAASDAAMSRFRSGAYVRLTAPYITYKSHPFTVNAVPNESNQLRVIFRALGPFTSRLASTLLAPLAPAPLIQLEGFYGVPDRVQQALQHDVIVLVAGGIGITPFLSMLHKLMSTVTLQSSYPLKRVVMHWACREACLIKYIRTEYLDPLLEYTSTSSAFQVQLIIHQTDFEDVKANTTPPLAKAIETTANAIAQLSEGGVPFEPSNLSPASKAAYSRNVLMSLSFAGTSAFGLYALWFCYTTIQKTDQIFGRVWAPMIILMVGGTIALAVNIYGVRFFPDEEPIVSAQWTALCQDEIDSVEIHDVAIGDENNNELLHLPEAGAVPVATLEVRIGRPTVHNFVNDAIKGASSPGLFVCGPASLLRDTRSAVMARCDIRMRQCIAGERRIAFYNESFHL